MRPAHLAVVALAAFLLGCAETPREMPEALFGTWTGGNSKVQSVRFSDGGRIELNGGECSGEYGLSAIDGNIADMRSGYIQCDGVMDGYTEGTLRVEGNDLTIDGTVLNGDYRRG